jgi:hypothetical protein
MSCGLACDPGYQACGGACTSVTSPLACGASCAICVAPADGTATCASGACGFSCNTGYVAVGTSCLASAPRPIAPLSGSFVTQQTPTLSWSLPAGIASAEVEVCGDRACTDVLSTQTVTGSSVAAPTLRVGVSYWRLFGVGAGGVGTVPSATWEIDVPGSVKAPVSGVWSAVPDYDGDGLADPVVQEQGGMYLFYGSPLGLPMSPSYTFPTMSAVFWGDVNGDGFVDLVADAYATSNLAVYHGGPSGLPGVTSEQPPMPYDNSVLGVGDINGDGYGDVVVGGGNSSTSIAVLLGSSSGLSTTYTTISSITGDSFSASAALVDVNSDGYADLVIGDPNYGSDVGQLYLYKGSAAGLSTTPVVINNPVGGVILFGDEVSVAGDVNGDGYPDVYVGVGAGGVCSGNCQQAFVLYGSSSGLGGHTVIPAPSGGGWFGSSGCTAGDVNADGYSDLIVGDGYWNDAPNHVFLGGPTGVSTTSATTLAQGLASGVGDTNGDGLGDVLIAPTGGIPVYVIEGTLSGLPSTPSETLTTSSNVSWLPHF